MFKRNSWCYLAILSCSLWISFGQELNVLPNLVRPYFFHVEQNLPINIMANISEKLFHLQKWGLNFGEKQKSLYCEWFQFKHLGRCFIVNENGFNLTSTIVYRANDAKKRL